MMPDLTITAEGFAFDPRADVWRLGSQRGPACFDFRRLRVSGPMMDEIKAVALYLVHRRATAGALGKFDDICSVIRDAASGSRDPLGVLRLADVDAYVRRLPPEGSYRANEVRWALRDWVRSGAAGLSDDLVDGLDLIRGEPFVMGKATRTCSASEGALSDSDVGRLVAGVVASHEAGRVSLKDCCLCLVSAMFGPRPSEMAALKVRDLVSRPGRGDALMLPTAKQRGLPIRGWLREATLIPSFSHLLHMQRDEATRLGEEAGLPAGEAPLLQRNRVLRGDTKDSYLEELKGHMSSRMVHNHICHTFDGLRALDHLGEGNSHVTPLRLRRSFATSRRDAGCSLEQIAIELGHRGGVQHVVVYLEPTPALAKEVDAALGGRMDGFFGSFGLDGREPGLEPRFGRSA